MHDSKNGMAPPGGRVKSGLVLGGGGARGLAQIGVLQVLERESYPVDLIAGTSMGGLIAGLYGLLGSSAALRELMAQPADNQATAFSRAPRAELYESRRFRRWLRTLFADRTFADLHWPVAVTAVDIDSGQELAINRGPVAPALWATTAIPGIYAPVEINGRRLVDGGVLNPLPVDLARRLGARVVLAVDVLPEPDRPAARLPIVYHQAMVRKVGVAMDLMAKSFDLLLSAQRDYRLRDWPADLLITPDLRGFRAMAYDQGAEIVARGVAAAEAVLPEIRRLRDQLLAAQPAANGGYQAGTIVPAQEHYR
ncbi:MAG TPA: patatin-like phospholipase family protein [Chloroflexia bacterium]|nr:patatin-like phospholipase family protein [Chloroflexia bacterium]